MKTIPINHHSIELTFIELTFAATVMYVCRQKGTAGGGSLSSCRLSVFFQKSTGWEMCTEVTVVPQTKKTKRHQCDGNSLVYTYHFVSPSVSLCHSVFSEILMLLAYFP